ncbi:MAG: glycosyltransferase family 2 protein [Selenomonadaceae bacterium]|nr:glycosyltransferase family 2 protein [Selenomonadaceae bacterium]
MDKPLVSVLVPNYNYSRFLGECLDSAVNQTYENLEIIILDNGSEDDSIAVARKYLSDSRVSLCRNEINIFNRSYRTLAEALASGKYQILLCSDDFIHKEFIEKAVRIMETYPNVGYVHGEKDLITEKGEKIYWDPFYRCSFIAPGKNAMPIYMMTTVAHPSQGVIRREAFNAAKGYDKEVDHMNADRTLWFYMSYQSDVAYIREKMCVIRIGESTETFKTQQNFQHPLLCHLTIKDFVKFAKEKELPKVYEREGAALNKLAAELLDYAAGMAHMESFEIAKNYLTYAKIISRKIVDTENYRILDDILRLKNKDDERLYKFIEKYEEKKRDYEPPDGYIEISV